MPFSQSPFFNVLWYDPDYSALEARFDALSEGKAIFVSLRELVLPLAQGAYRADMGEIKLHLPEETFEAAGTLLAELKGGVRLTPTTMACALPITARAARNCRATASRAH